MARERVRLQSHAAAGLQTNLAAMQFLFGYFARLHARDLRVDFGEHFFVSLRTRAGEEENIAASSPVVRLERTK